MIDTIYSPEYSKEKFSKKANSIFWNINLFTWTVFFTKYNLKQVLYYILMRLKKKKMISAYQDYFGE